MDRRTCPSCKVSKLPNDFVGADGKPMKWCCECRNANGVRSRAGRRRAEAAESNPNPATQSRPDRVVDFNALPTSRKLTMHRDGRSESTFGAEPAEKRCASSRSPLR